MDRTEDRSKEPKTKLVLDDGRIESIQEFISPEELYQDLIERVRKYHPSDDISMIEKAYRLADNAHQGQVRKSGEPYIIHPLCVAIILADLELDKETIVAGLLHDVVEDTVMTVEQVGEQFGTDVAFLVDGVTKLQHLHLADNSGNKTEAQLEMQAENLRKMFMAMAKDIRVIMIKLADRPPQYAHPQAYAPRKADTDCAGDDGHLCAHCTASRYFQDQGRTGRSFVKISRTGRLL